MPCAQMVTTSLLILASGDKTYRQSISSSATTNKRVLEDTVPLATLAMEATFVIHVLNLEMCSTLEARATTALSA